MNLGLFLPFYVSSTKGLTRCYKMEGFFTALHGMHADAV